MNYVIYINRPQGTGELGLPIGPLIGPLIGSASGIFQQIMGLFGGAGKRSGLPYGLAGITSFGNQVIETLNQVKTAIANPQITAEQAAQLAGEAQKLQGSLTTGVYQAQKGKDAAALQGFKKTASQLVGEIQQIAASKPATPQTIQTPSGPMVQTVGPNGQTILVPASTGGTEIFGIPLTTLLLFGGGALVLVFMLRR